MAIVVTGASGLLGREVVAELERRGESVVSPAAAELDVTDPDAVEDIVAGARPRAVIHCAAVADVDACGRERERAWQVNAESPGYVGASCARHGARAVCVSTDYVFAGDAGRAYVEDDPVGPINYYGETKLAGERAAAAACEDCVVARVSWLFGSGRPTFVTWLAEQARYAVGPIAVSDQRGTPTSATAAARALCDLAIIPGARGVFHVSCAGDATRVEIARAVLDHLRSTRDVVVTSFTEPPAEDCRRPHDTRLAHPRLGDVGIRMPRWQTELVEFLDRL